ncbi:hypothetical protein SAMN02745673_04712 [Marinactinospora thermotolerans DSM 45154]|uniref:Uncharacterized protein n=1 Tax=Marinactinospora thermotolerans DSM 45154 TaxID=1122192 RepID=A0A1T4TAM8_9ACTN|nr:hypothetical protein SAMN02745673_04712 [Marinactinospora thermotolerans DSM 45154]
MSRVTAPRQSVRRRNGSRAAVEPADAPRGTGPGATHPGEGGAGTLPRPRSPTWPGTAGRNRRPDVLGPGSAWPRRGGASAGSGTRTIADAAGDRRVRSPRGGGHRSRKHHPSPSTPSRTGRRGPLPPRPQSARAFPTFVPGLLPLRLFTRSPPGLPRPVSAGAPPLTTVPSLLRADLGERDVYPPQAGHRKGTRRPDGARSGPSPPSSRYGAFLPSGRLRARSPITTRFALTPTTVQR